MKKMQPGSLNVHVHVVSQPGGAVPVIYTARSAKPFNTCYALQHNCCRTAHVVLPGSICLCLSRTPVAEFVRCRLEGLLLRHVLHS